MGSSHIKDQNIQIFMQISKQFYLSGDVVEGQVYIQVKKPSQYTKLVVGVEGQQYVYWSQGSGNQRRYYKNQYKNYSSFFVVMDFNGFVQQGDYIFPFAFVLPNMITGSYFHSKHCYLKYMIKTQLIHPSQPKRNQFYQMFLNILEPPRNPIGPATLTNTVNSKCCGCCADYGFTSVTLNCDRNFVMNGDLLQINGCVDNSRGNKVVDTRIVLERRRFMVSNRGNVKNTVQEEFQYQRLPSIQPSGSSNFNFSAKVPDTLVSCTAIGKIVANYYVLHLYTDYGCCANKADAQIHLVVHSRTPLIVKPQILPQPQNWYPRSFPKVIYQNMSPYLYVPDPKIPFINQQTQAMNNNYMQGSYPNLDPYSNRDNTLVEEMSQNRTNTHQNWGNNNYNYKPVFHDEEMVNDAQRQFYANQQNPNQENLIYRKL